MCLIMGVESFFGFYWFEVVWVVNVWLWVFVFLSWGSILFNVFGMVWSWVSWYGLWIYFFYLFIIIIFVYFLLLFVSNLYVFMLVVFFFFYVFMIFLVVFGLKVEMLFFGCFCIWDLVLIYFKMVLDWFFWGGIDLNWIVFGVLWYICVIMFVYY